MASFLFSCTRCGTQYKLILWFKSFCNCNHSGFRFHAP